MGDGDISINLRMNDGDFSVTVRNATRLLSELKRSLDSTAGSTGAVENHFNSLTTRLRHTVMTLASVRFALMDIHDVFLQLPKSILRTTGEVERMTKLMEGLSKETDSLARKQEALANTKFVFNVAQNAPFEVKAISDAFVKLKIAGLDPAAGTLQTLIDSLARFGGSSEHLHRASVAIQQMTGKGVISMEELRQQLGEAMPTAMRAMAEGTGMTMSELVNKISKGSVEATSALERMFAVLRVENSGAALAMMDTYVGQIEKLKTTWTIFANEVGQSGGFAKEVVAQLKEISAALSSADAKTFAHDLSVGLAATVRWLADAVRFARNYSGELTTLAQAMLAIWGGGKLFAMINSMKAAYGGFLTTYIGGVKSVIAAERERVMVANANATQEIANKRRVIMEEARANAQRISQNAAAAAAELAQNRAKWAALEAEGNAYRARYHAAEQVATTRRLANGRFVSAAEAATQRALATAYFERAMAAERMAARIKAAEAGLVATSTGAMAALRANTVAATTAMGGLGTATVATTSRMAVLRGALGLLGGPIGWITTLLTAGAFAWFQWGNSAEKAAAKAADALQRVKNGYASLEDASTMRARIDDIDKAVAEKEQDIKGGGGGVIGYSPSKIAQLRADIAALKEERTKLDKELSNAIAQGGESAIQDAVRLINDSVQREVAAKQTASTILAEKEREQLDARLKEGKVSQEEHYKQRIALTRKLGMENAQAEIDVIKGQRATVERAIQELSGGGNTQALETAKRQFADLSKSLRNAEEQLASAMKIGTAAGDTKGGKGGSGGSGDSRSPISGLLDQARADLAAASIKLDDLADGVISFQRLRDAVMAEIQGDIQSGKLKGADAASVAELADLRAQLEQRKAEIAAEKKLNKLESDVAVERKAAAARFDNSETYAKESTGVAKLRKELERIKQTLPETSEMAKQFAETTKKLVSEQAIADLQNFAADLKEASNELEVALLPTERARQERAYEDEIARQREHFAVRRKHIVDDAKATSEERVAAIKLAEDELNKWLTLKAQEHAKAMRTPLQQLAEEWSDTYKQIGQLEAKWANGFIDTLHDAIMEGRADWRGFLKGMVSDLLRMNLRQVFASQISGGIRSAQGGYSGYAPTPAGGSSGGSSGGFGMPGVPGMDMMGMTAKGLSWLGGATGMTGLTSFAAGMGMTSYTSATAMAGLAEAGLVSGVTNATAASAGSLLGGLSTAMPYVAAALFAAQALGLFDKKPSDKSAWAHYNPNTGKAFDIGSMTGKKDPGQEARDATAATAMLLGSFSGMTGNDSNLSLMTGQRDGIRLHLYEGFKSPEGEVYDTYDGTPIRANYGTDMAEALPKMLNDLIDEGTLPQETIDRWKSLQTNVDGSARDAVELVDVLALINQELTDTEILRADLIQVEGETLGQAATRIRDINSAMDPLTANEAWIKGMGDLADIFYDVGLELPHTNSEFLSLIDSLDLTTQAGQDAYRALIGVAPAFSNVTQVVMSALDSISKTTADSIRDIEMSLLDDEGKYNYLDDELEGLVTSLKSAFDPTEITSLVEQINSKTLEAWNLLDETQRQQVGTEFLDRIRYAEEISKERLDPETAASVDKAEKEKEESDSANKAALESATAQKEAAAATAGAANAHASAASALLSAAQALSAASDRIASSNTSFNGALSNITSALANLSLSEIGGR